MNKYKGYQYFVTMFGKFWRIVNRGIISSDNIQNINWLVEEFYPWFSKWEKDSIERGQRILELKHVGQTKFPITQLYNFFFTIQATKDIKNVCVGTYELMKYMTGKFPKHFFYLHRISQDVIEHSFASNREISGSAVASGSSAIEAARKIQIKALCRSSFPARLPTEKEKRIIKRTNAKNHNFINLDIVNEYMGDTLLAIPKPPTHEEPILNISGVTDESSTTKPTHHVLFVSGNDDLNENAEDIMDMINLVDEVIEVDDENEEVVARNLDVAPPVYIGDYEKEIPASTSDFFDFKIFDVRRKEKITEFKRRGYFIFNPNTKIYELITSDL